MNPITNFDIELLKNDFEFLIEWGYVLNQDTAIQGNNVLEYKSNQKKIEISIDINTYSINVVVYYGFLNLFKLELPKDIPKITLDKVNLDDYLINQSENLNTQEKLKQAIILYELLKKLMKEDLRDFLQGGASIFNINPISYFDIELLKNDFDFLIEWGYILTSESANRGEYGLKYENNKKTINIMIDLSNYSMYVIVQYGFLHLFKLHLLKDISKITKSKINLEDFRIIHSLTSDSELRTKQAIIWYELILKLMKEDLKDFLQGKRFRF
jgi:hypothetical protein